ncbi:MAG: hypothetical protein PVH18_14015, partial [Chloroflexota bacterium]
MRRKGVEKREDEEGFRANENGLNNVTHSKRQKSIAIIGAGVAGLAAGCYGQMNGYQTHIFELHDL